MINPLLIAVLSSILYFVSSQDSPPSPPPGCVFDTSNVANKFFCYGMQLILKTCNSSDQSQKFISSSGNPIILHDDASTLAIEAFINNNEDGFSSSLGLSTIVPNYPMQQWYANNRLDTDDTIISNIPDITQNLNTIIGCLQWTVPLIEENVTIVPAKCVEGDVKRSWAFDPPNMRGLIMALTDPTNPTSYSNLCVAVDQSIRVDPFVIDDQKGANFGKIFGKSHNTSSTTLNLKLRKSKALLHLCSIIRYSSTSYTLFYHLQTILPFLSSFSFYKNRRRWYHCR